MKYKNLSLAFLFLIAITGIVFGISLYFQRQQSALGIFVIIGASLLGVATFISGLNDAYDLIGKVSGQKNQLSLETPGQDDSQYLKSIWDRLEPNLQDALSMAYNQSRREGQVKIRTRYFFAAMVRLSPDPLPEMLKHLPPNALPNPIDEDITTESILLAESIELSACVEESLKELVPKSTKEHKISSIDLFVDIAKHGTGSSVEQLRRYDVTPGKVDRLVGELGWELIQR